MAGADSSLSSALTKIQDTFLYIKHLLQAQFPHYFPAFKETLQGLYLQSKFLLMQFALKE